MPLVIAGAVGGIYDFLLSTFNWWSENLSTKVIPWCSDIATNAKMVMKVNTSAAILGLGYIVGLKYSFIIFAGSAFVWFIIVPLLGMNPELAAAEPEVIFSGAARYIGIGGIAMSGVIGIIKSWPIIKNAVGLAGKELKGNSGNTTSILRTQKDMSMKLLAFSLLAALMVTFIFFYVGVIHNLVQTVVAFLVVAVIAFLFTTVAANAIAIVGSNPVSGMTLMTLIISSGIFVSIGLKGSAGIIASMVIGGVVCTALSMAGGMVTDMKVGYWLGTTPAKQQTWKFLGTLVSAATVGGVMILLNKTYGFASGSLAAPQANAMAAVIDPLMNGVGAPWVLYGVGALIAIVLTWFKIPALACALGMFIPIELNTPLLVGGLASWYVTTRSKDAKVNSERGEKGTLLASGFIAGGALMGVVSAMLRFGGINLVSEEWMANPLSELCSLGAYILLVLYFVHATKTKK